MTVSKQASKSSATDTDTDAKQTETTGMQISLGNLRYGQDADILINALDDKSIDLNSMDIRLSYYSNN